MEKTKNIDNKLYKKYLKEMKKETLDEFIHTYANNNTWISELNSAQYEILCNVIEDWNDIQKQELLIRVKELEDKYKTKSDLFDKYYSEMIQLQSDKQELIEGIEKNKNLLINACEYFTSANDVEMDKYDLESWITEVGNKLNLALSNYKDKQNGNNI